MFRQWLIILFVLILNATLYAQWNDQFEDGDITANPSWVGDITHFCVNSNHELQLCAEEAGESILVLPCNSIAPEWEWNFYIRLNFSPSANNFTRIYLVSDTSQLQSSNRHSIFLQFGESLNNDALELFYQDSNQIVSICRGENGRIAASFSLFVKVLLHQNQFWEILIDEVGNGEYRTECSGLQVSPSSQTAFGIYCKYTIGNIRNCFFDNIYSGPPIIDTIPPSVIEVLTEENGKNISVLFSEKISTESATNKNNFLIDDIIIPDSALQLYPNYENAILKLSTELKDEVVHKLTVQNIEDLSGNLLNMDSIYFFYFRIHRNDILITEIMSDPSPPLGLPNCEYVEIFNRNIRDTVNLKNWSLKLGNIHKTLPEIYLHPNEYAVVIPQAFVNDFPESCKTIPISTMSITNDGQIITLYNTIGEVIHIVDFSKNWHQNPLKQEGGWSLEMIDTQNPCAGISNWNSSNDPSGGTPGYKNSINQENLDFLPPEILKVVVTDSITVKVFYNETILGRVKSTTFQIDNNIIIDSISEVPPLNNTLILHLQTPLAPKIIYTLSQIDSILDCSGNVSYEQKVLLGIPEEIAHGDIIINELLFNSYGDTEADFVELYNHSDKILDLSNLIIGYGGDDVPNKTVIADGTGFLFFPQQYVVISKNAKLNKEHYFVNNPKNLIQCDSLPAFANSEGIIHLLTKSLMPIDRFDYNEKMHYSMLSTVDGVSLERIHAEMETQNVNNWKSAAESAGFSTPTYVNSQALSSNEITDDFQIIPKIISPNNDGIDDFCEITCHFEDPENRLTITIYDTKGNTIIVLANNQICRSEEIIRWDGNTSNGTIVSENLYLVELVYWNLKGKKQCIKRSVAVVR